MVAIPAQPRRLLDQLRSALRVRHCSRRTEDAYVYWTKRFILFHGKRHPRDMNGTNVGTFLSHLAVHGHVSASTQNQALCAILFLYRHVLKTDLGDVTDVVRAHAPQRLPVVLTRDEIRSLLGCLDGTPRLVARLLDGSGLRLLEGLAPRVKDIDARHQIIDLAVGRAGSYYPMPSTTSTRMPRQNGDGDSSSRPRASVETPDGVRRRGTTSIPQ